MAFSFSLTTSSFITAPFHRYHSETGYEHHLSGSLHHLATAASNEDEDDGAEDGEICEEDEGKEEGDEMADDDQIEDPKKKKMDIKESYIAKASHWM